jgi:hypothetical protein
MLFRWIWLLLLNYSKELNMNTFEQILSVVTEQALYGKYTAMSADLQSAFIRYTSSDMVSERINRVKLQTPINESASVAYIVEDINTNTLELRVDRFRRSRNYELVWTKTNIAVRWEKTEFGYTLIDDAQPVLSIIRQKIGELVPHTPKCYYIANTGENLTSIDWSWVTVEGKVRTDSLLNNNVSYVCSVIRPVPSNIQNTTIVECGTACTENTVFLTDSPCFC